LGGERALAGRFWSELKRRNVVRVGGVYVVTAWGLFQIAKTVFETFGLPKWSSPLLLTLLAVGLPITLIISWAFERAPEGVRRTAPADEEAEPVRFSRMDAILLGVSGLVVAVAGAQMIGLGRSGRIGGAPEKSVAVLPFVNFSAQPDAEYFADGLTEEIINSLAQIDDLKVAGRTSAFYFKGKNEDLRLIGQKLGVAHVVEGSVRRSGEALRVTAQLIAVKDGFHLWSETFDRREQDAFAIQTEIADAVAEALKIRLESRAPREGEAPDPETYRLLLTARAHLRRVSLEDLQEARRIYEQVTTAAPDSAAAWAGYAQATIILAQNYMAMDFGEAERISATAIDRAMQLDPANVDAWLASAYLARIRSIRAGSARYAKAQEQAVRRALQLDPRNVEALTLQAMHLSETGRHKEAIASINRALAIDPLNRFSQMILAGALRRSGQLAAAAAQYRKTIELYPDFADAHQNLGELMIEMGKLAEAEPWLKVTADPGNDPNASLQLALLYANLGLTDRADAVLAAFKTPPASVYFAVIRMGLRGDFAGALKVGQAQAAIDKDLFWPNVIMVGAMMTGAFDVGARQGPIASPELMSPEPVIAATDLATPVALAYLLDGAGDRPQAKRILHALIAATERPAGAYVDHEIRINRAKAFALLGDAERAVGEIQAAVGAGWRLLMDGEDFVWLDQHPTVASLKSDRRFVAAMAEVRADLGRQRAQLVAQAS
jgi:TolB-like protein/Tfp pilus assembly protein PilF